MNASKSSSAGFFHNIAVANNCTHLLTNVAGVVLVRRKDFGFEVGEIREGVVNAWHITDLAVSELCPINGLGGDGYDRDDVKYHINRCPVPVLEAIASEVYPYPETQQAPVTQEHADCWGVTIQQVWEFALPAFSRAVEQGYKVGSYSPSKVASDV